MFTTTKIALSFAIVLGAASAALAGSKDDDGAGGGGFKVRTQQEMVQTRQNFLSRYHLGDAGNAFAYAPSPGQKHGSSRK